MALTLALVLPWDLDTVPEFGNLHLGYSLPLHPSSPFWQLSVHQHFLSHSHHFFPPLTPLILQNFHYLLFFYSTSLFQLRPATQLCQSLCDPWIAAYMPGFPGLHQIPELAKTHVHWVNDAIQLSHSVIPFSPCPHVSQHQGLFKWVSSFHPVAKLLELQLQYQSFQWIFRANFL